MSERLPVLCDISLDAVFSFPYCLLLIYTVVYDLIVAIIVVNKDDYIHVFWSQSPGPARRPVQAVLHWRRWD